MKDILKTLAVVTAYSAGVVVGITATSMAIVKIEEVALNRKVKKLNKELDSAGDGVLAAALATSLGVDAAAAVATARSVSRNRPRQAA